MPPTRYQGSKRRFIDWIGAHLSALEFDTALDAFGGSAVVAHWLKGRGKAVTYNDVLHFNYQVGTALVENDGVSLEESDVQRILTANAGERYNEFIARTFDDVYYTAEENAWLDVAAQNIARVSDRLKRAVAWYALFQSAIAKRPYNLFHRRNLYLRMADVPRSFGNKATWDRPFEIHFREHAARAAAAIFRGERRCRAVCADAAAVQGEYDLVYIDPPYLNSRGVGADYLGFYHFLEGLVRYAEWPGLFDPRSKHRAMRREPSPWTSPAGIHGAFQIVIERFADSTLVVSYRSDGIPSVDELVTMVRAVKPRISVFEDDRFRYALSTNKLSKEILIVGAG